VTAPLNVDPFAMLVVTVNAGWELLFETRTANLAVAVRPFVA
jgi:hypothetical protein